MMKLNKSTIKNYKDWCEIKKGIFDIYLRKTNIKENDPDLYVIDVFANFIKDNNKAHQKDLSDVFDELWEAIEYLEDELYIPKKSTKQIKMKEIKWNII